MHIDPTMLAVAVKAARTSITTSSERKAIDTAALFLLVDGRRVEQAGKGKILIVSRCAIFTACTNQCQCRRSRKTPCQHMWLARLCVQYLHALSRCEAA